jgi:AcrR family transcriptional regulator
MTTPGPSTAVVAVDGRTARRDRNRDLVLDAVIQLFTEDQFAPNAAAVAERSGVSLRSVYRYFQDHDALVRAAIARNAERVAPFFDIPDLGKGPLDERVTRLISCRLRLYQEAAPTARAAIVRAPANPILRDQLESVRAMLRKQTVAMFAPELAAMTTEQRRAVTDAIDTLLQFESAEHLVGRLDLTPAQTADVLGRALTSLLTHPT